MMNWFGLYKWLSNDVTTPPKTNMEPENGPLEKEIPIGNHPFPGSMLIFGGVTIIEVLDGPNRDEQS